jgi:hypothetical protein
MTTKKHNFQISSLIFAFLVVGILGAPLHAGDFHSPPRDFRFGNHIDTHQETKLVTSGNAPVRLSGFLYIIYTGEIDGESGLPLARHPRGAGEHNEECGVDVDCVAGWLINGVPISAKFLYHSGVNGHDHPVWMVNRVDIIQPGSYTHFHWITASSNDPRARSVIPPCDKNNAGQLETQALTAVNEYCDGWFLELRATKNFAFEHGGEIIPVRTGIDNATHLNLVTNYEEIPGISGTR